MAEIVGNVGAVYKSDAYNKSTGIAFVDSNPDTITDSNSGFTVAKGFSASMNVTVYGSTSNDGDYVITARADGSLTTSSSIALAEIAGDTVYVYSQRPGTVMLGFYNWSLDNGVDMLDVTDFGDGGYRSFISGLKAWTATAEKHYYTTEHQDSLMGMIVWVRFFTGYNAAPNVTNAYFYEGPAFISGISTNTPVDGVITQTIAFQGVGPLRQLTQSVAW